MQPTKIRLSALRRVRRLAIAVVVMAGVLMGQTSPESKKTPPSDEHAATAATPQPGTDATAPASSATEPNAGGPATSGPVTVNLLGRTNTAVGESRRNENIQFNLVDNNAIKELNVRLGVSATIITDMRPERGYFGAEFGATPSAPIHVTVPKASAWHGNVYYQHLNSAFSARSFFQVGDVKPAREHDYGFRTSFGIGRGTTVSIDGSQQRLRGSVNGNVLVPTLDERTPLTTDPLLIPIVLRFLNAYPRELPNRTDINARALNTNAPQIIDNNNAGIRLNQSLGAKDSLTATYQFTAQSVDAFQLVAGQNPDTDTKSHRARLTWLRTLSAATLLEFSAGLDRVGSLLVPEPNSVGPMISTSGITTLGPAGGIPIDRAENVFRYAAQVRHTVGNHALIAGAQFSRRQFNGIMTDTHRGFFSFANDFGTTAFNNLRLGRPSQHLIALGDPYRGYRNNEYLFYAGDQWRVRPSLTINYSLRYEPTARPTEVHHMERIPYDPDRNNVGGHFGVAKQLPGHWGIVRAGAGVEFGQIFPVTYQQIRFSPPNTYKIVLPAPYLADPMRGVDLSDLSSFIPTTYPMDPDLATPYSYLYNVAWERQLGAHLRMQLGYVGSRSHKLLLMWYQNRAHVVPGIEQTTATWNLRRPNPRFAEIRTVLNGSQGYYDAGRASLILNEWHGLSLDASYWFSKAIDLGSSYTNTAFDADSRISRSQYEYDQFRDMRGPSDFNQPHAFLARISYLTPQLVSTPWARKVLGSWNFAAIALMKTGTPFTVQSGSDAPGWGNVDANGQDRPNLVDPSVLGRTIGNPDTSARLLPRAAFQTIAPTDNQGNLGRNTFQKGAIRNVNASLSRRWFLPGANGDHWLEFRAESINLFNTPQFAEPGFELSNPNFGAITNTLNDGRTFRFRLEVGW
ncbi:MAG: hypothetical protein LC114_13935 [Bryobacterales bacterium]|nr:hypothetical protein [Bryobacterales bacterium]